jgi:hypothetical protein
VAAVHPPHHRVRLANLRQDRNDGAKAKESYSHLSLERFRTASKYHDRPAAADIAFCVAAYSLGMPDDAMASALDIEYLSRDPNPARKAAYIQRTMAKARLWANR